MWGYVVIDCIVCDMIKYNISLCMRMSMFNIILWILLYYEFILWTVCAWDLSCFWLVCDIIIILWWIILNYLIGVQVLNQTKIWYDILQSHMSLPLIISHYGDNLNWCITVYIVLCHVPWMLYGLLFSLYWYIPYWLW